MQGGFDDIRKGLVSCHSLIFSKVLYKDVGNNLTIWIVMNFQESQFLLLLFCHQYRVISIVITLFLKIKRNSHFRQKCSVQK